LPATRPVIDGALLAKETKSPKATIVEAKRCKRRAPLRDYANTTFEAMPMATTAQPYANLMSITVVKRVLNT